MQLLASKPHLLVKMQQLIEARKQQLSQQLLSQQQLLPTGMQQQKMQQSASQPSRISTLEQLLTSDTSNLLPNSSSGIVSPQSSSNNDVASMSTGSSSASFPSDLDLTFPDSELANIDCDIDQVINLELGFGDSLDFSFDPPQPPGNCGGTDDLDDFLFSA